MRYVDTHTNLKKSVGLRDVVAWMDEEDGGTMFCFKCGKLEKANHKLNPLEAEFFNYSFNGFNCGRCGHWIILDQR